MTQLPPAWLMIALILISAPGGPMADYARVIIVGGTIGALATLSLASAVYLTTAEAQEVIDTVIAPAKQLFAPGFDPERLKKFDIAVGDSVSTEVEHTEIVGKIAFGKKSTVTILSTPSGTYSSDALLSPNVHYPGIEVTRKAGPGDWALTYSLSPDGAETWQSFSSGSFTWLNYSFAPAARAHT